MEKYPTTMANMVGIGMFYLCQMANMQHIMQQIAEGLIQLKND